MQEPGFSDATIAARARDALKAASYHAEGMHDLLGEGFSFAPPAESLPMWIERTAGGSSLETFLRVLLFGVEVPLRDFEAALSRSSALEWQEAGLIEVDGDTVRPQLTVAPIGGALCVSDLPSRAKDPARPDFVMGVGAASSSLAAFTPRQHVARALDLGCGCGVHAFLASSHADSVVAVDVNPRAVALTRLGAQLSGIENIEARAGDLFTPVEGERFDLIVSNPPFVISPETRYVYRDGGLGGDRFVQRVVREGAAHLESGGYLVILANWAYGADGDWQKRVEPWFEGLGCDVWVLAHEIGDAATYARTWIEHTEANRPEEFAERFKAWMQYYESEGIAGVAAGSIILRRREGRTSWTRCTRAPRIAGSWNEDVLLFFACQDLLAGLRSEEDLLDARLRLVPKVRLEQRCEPRGAAWEPIETFLIRSSGLAYAGKVNQVIATLTARCDGRRTVGEILDRIAKEESARPDLLRRAAFPAVRSLVDQLFLVPREAGT